MKQALQTIKQVLDLAVSKAVFSSLQETATVIAAWNEIANHCNQEAKQNKSPENEGQ